MNTERVTAGQGAVDFGSEADPPPPRAVGLAVVAAVHLIVGYALVTGLAREAIEVVKKPLLATIVQEVKVPEPPPPPPPPKKIKTAEPAPQAPPSFVPPPEVTPAPSQGPAITAVATPPPVEAPAAPAPPVEPPAAVVATPSKMDIGVACPTQVKPEIPQRALVDGISGVVRVQVRIHAGRVSEVAILAGPKVFHDAVRRAMLQYRCAVTGDADVVAVQDIKFEVE